MKLKHLYEDYRSGPYVFPTDPTERAQSFKGPTDFEPHKDASQFYKKQQRQPKKKKKN